MRALALALVMAACSSPPAPAAKATDGRVVLRFAMNANVRKSPQLVDAPKGRVRGSIYLAEDVSLAGPRQGAQAVAPVAIDVDLTADAPSAQAVELPPLAENRYAFLGFLDVDGNGAATERPDQGDLVTVPSKETQFEVVAGARTDATVAFNLVYDM